MSSPLAPLSDSERVDWLQLTRSEGIGPRTFAGLLGRFGSAAAALAALPSLAKKRAGVVVASRDVALREIEGSVKRNLRILTLNEPDYPAPLRAIDSPPPVITVRGQVAVLHQSLVAIVGSRNASGPGLIVTERLARGLGAAGCIVVSGLARGIDARAHQAALPTGTVAVLAGGHDRIYPSEHGALAARIAETGAVISEMPPEWEPRARDFPRRNRIVSGLAMATVVVEAARRSGSLITARFANEQGREVFAVPGSPLEPRAEGTNDLLRQGATLCTGADDITDSLARLRAQPETLSTAPRLLWEQPSTDALMPSDDDDTSDGFDGTVDDTRRIAGLIGPTPIALDDLVRLSGLGVHRVRTIVFDLELVGAASIERGMVAGTGSPIT